MISVKNKPGDSVNTEQIHIMKKLLFLASFVFETGKDEYKDSQLVMVTDKDVMRSTEKQKALNPEKGPRTHELDHYDAAYDVFHDWFKGAYPESTLKHIICNRPIQSELFREKEAPRDLSFFASAHTPKEIPEKDPKEEDLSYYVLIDINGNRDQDDFAIGYYNFSTESWFLKGIDDRPIDQENLKWMDLPIDKK